MKLLVTGAAGQLGTDVVSEARKRGMDVYGVGAEEMDITDSAKVMQVMGTIHPDAVIHCAGWTAVDAAEEEQNRDRVQRVNVEGTENIARTCRMINAKMMYISTDYVFSGQGTEPWKPDCTDFAPLSWYGETKLRGEQIVSKMLDKFFIVRIAWAFGKNGKNFVKTMYSAGKANKEVRVVCDQIGTPTYTPDLSRLLVDMILTDKYGYYHATNEGGYISWYDFACEIFRQAGIDTAVKPVTSAEYGLSLAKRPGNSRLDKTKLRDMGFEPLPDWKDALGRYIEELKKDLQ